MPYLTLFVFVCLFILVFCVVCLRPMCCLSLSYVLCTKCFQFLRFCPFLIDTSVFYIVYLINYNYLGTVIR
jgi:hypothetical protein